MKFLLSILALVVTMNAVFAAPAQEEKMVAVVLMMDDGDDQQIVATIYTSLMAAEKVAKILDIEMIAEDEVNDDVFVFSLKSEEQRVLTMKILDSEGYKVAAHRVLQVEDGNNYNALKVSSLEDGTYEFIIEDANGASKSQKLIINKDNK